MAFFLSQANGPENQEFVNLVIIEVSPGFAREILEWIQRVASMKKENIELYCVEIWNYNATFALQHGDSPDDLALIDGETLLLAPGDKPPPHEEVRSETMTMIITNDGVLWRGYVKHTGVQIESNSISIKELEEVARG